MADFSQELGSLRQLPGLSLRPARLRRILGMESMWQERLDGWLGEIKEMLPSSANKKSQASV